MVIIIFREEAIDEEQKKKRKREGVGLNMVKYFQKLRKTETLLRASMHTVDFYVFSPLFLGLIFRVCVYVCLCARMCVF